MSAACKSCGSNDITIESCERICINCGEVQDELIDEGQLCMLPDNEAIEDNFRNKNYEATQRLTNRIRGEANDSAARRRISREKLLDDSRRVVKQLMKEPRALDETMDLVKSAFAAHEGRLINSKRLGLVGACIYYLSAKHQLGISLADICKTVGIKMKIMSVCLKQVKSLCPNFEYERPNIRDQVKKFIDDLTTKHYDLSSLDNNELENYSTSAGSSKSCNQPQTLINSSDRLVLYNRVMLLIDVFEVMHPYSQPTPQCLITAVVYHAWRSLDTFKMIAKNLCSRAQVISTGKAVEQNEQYHERKNVRIQHSVSYDKFCHICGIKYSKNGHKIVSKIQSSLLMLGKCFGDVNKVNLPWFLKDIIENSPHLIQEHLGRPDVKSDNK